MANLDQTLPASINGQPHPRSGWKNEFTVFTATYNRAHTLHRVYESLSAQTFQDFEWLIIDDGSTDGTGTLVRHWMDEASSFPIRYIHQGNQGKHVALNRGVLEARGRFFLNLDSDDSCVPWALERFRFHWNAIPETQRQTFCGLTALCRRPDGTLVGGEFPSKVMDCSVLDMNYRYDCRWEKWGFLVTSIVRQYPYPVIEGERFVAESLIFNRMGLQYQTRWVSEALRIYHDTPQSLTRGSTRVRNCKSAAMYYREFISLAYPMPLRHRLRAYTNYFRYSVHVMLHRRWTSARRRAKAPTPAVTLPA